MSKLYNLTFFVKLQEINSQVKEDIVKPPQECTSESSANSIWSSFIKPVEQNFSLSDQLQEHNVKFKTEANRLERGLSDLSLSSLIHENKIVSKHDTLLESKELILKESLVQITFKPGPEPQLSQLISPAYSLPKDVIEQQGGMSCSLPLEKDWSDNTESTTNLIITKNTCNLDDTIVSRLTDKIFAMEHYDELKKNENNDMQSSSDEDDNRSLNTPSPTTIMKNLQKPSTYYNPQTVVDIDDNFFFGYEPPAHVKQDFGWVHSLYSEKPKPNRRYEC